MTSIPSPCIGNCCLDTDDVCLGCFRTLTEIKRWTEADNKTRQQFINNAQDRQRIRACQGVLHNNV
ncbi:MAG: DUF1289 domain-containing protein [Methylovulum sp.]|nr:DUF1289 domain-containing protein [Methylovulum sp.]